jgi:pilus assembly protein Flp/PilA
MLKHTKGQALVEYGLIIALIACVCVGSLTTIGTNLDTKLGKVGTAIGGASGEGTPPILGAPAEQMMNPPSEI